MFPKLRHVSVVVVHSYTDAFNKKEKLYTRTIRDKKLKNLKNKQED